jgi:hypothetical protein
LRIDATTLLSRDLRRFAQNHLPIAHPVPEFFFDRWTSVRPLSRLGRRSRRYRTSSRALAALAVGNNKREPVDTSTALAPVPMFTVTAGVDADATALPKMFHAIVRRHELMPRPSKQRAQVLKNNGFFCSHGHTDNPWQRGDELAFRRRFAVSLHGYRPPGNACDGQCSDLTDARKKEFEFHVELQSKTRSRI